MGRQQGDARRYCLHRRSTARRHASRDPKLHWAAEEALGLTSFCASIRICRPSSAVGAYRMASTFFMICGKWGRKWKNKYAERVGSGHVHGEEARAQAETPGACPSSFILARLSWLPACLPAHHYTSRAPSRAHRDVADSGCLAQQLNVPQLGVVAAHVMRMGSSGHEQGAEEDAHGKGRPGSRVRQFDRQQRSRAGLQISAWPIQLATSDPVPFPHPHPPHPLFTTLAGRLTSPSPSPAHLP